MNLKNALRLLTVISTCLVWEKAFSAESAATRPIETSVATLKSISSESNDDKTTIYIEFDAPLSTAKPSVEEHGNFLQFQLKNTIVINPGNFIDGSGPYVQKIVPFQTNPKDAAIRLFVDRKASEIASATFVDTLENRLLVTVDHRKIASADILNAKIAAVSAEMTKETPTSNEAIGSTMKVGESSAEKLPPELTSDPQRDNLNLQSKMIVAAIFCVVMLLIGAAALVFRPSIRKRMGNAGLEIPAFKTLSSHTVGPKQKISIIKVGNERLLLGVTTGSITLLKNLDERVSESVSPVARVAIQSPERPRTIDQRALPDKPNPSPRALNAPVPQRTVLNSYSNHADRSPPADLDGVQVNLRTTSRPSAPSSGKVARPTLPRTGNSKVRAGSVDDVTKLIREKLKNLPQAT